MAGTCAVGPDVRLPAPGSAVSFKQVKNAGKDGSELASPVAALQQQSEPLHAVAPCTQVVHADWGSPQSVPWW